MAAITATLNIRIPVALAEALDAEAKRSGRTKTEIVIAGLQHELAKEAATMTVNIVALTDTAAEQVDSFEVALAGTDAEIIAEAQRLVAAKGHRIMPDEDGGCCEITHYSGGTPPAVAVTVWPTE